VKCCPNVPQRICSKYYGYGSDASLTDALTYALGNPYFVDNENPLDGYKTTIAVNSPMIYSRNLAFGLDKDRQPIIDPVISQRSRNPLERSIKTVSSLRR
jgi:hypothetical protein